MKKTAASLFFIFLSLATAAQRTIRGRVIHAATGEVIPGSSVFISNTSKGTVSDAAGQFELREVPAGKHELIISSIGFETLVYPFNETQLPLQLRAELTVKVKELENLLLEPYVEEGWDKWGKTFTENFIGYTENAARCRIRNQESIRFRYFKKSNRLIAFCEEPLKIENRALGYLISYQLEEFELNFTDKICVFTGYSLYEENRNSRKALQRKRDEAYNGSLLHFIRSLYGDSLEQNGFEVRRMVRVPNAEKERVKAVFMPLRTTSMGGGVTMITDNVPAGLHPDTVTYYRRIMRQPDYTEVVGRELVKADSLLLKQEGDFKLFYFTDFLQVIYRNELEPEAYLRWQMRSGKPSYQQSLIYLPELNPLWIDRNGNYYNPRDMFSTGYWSWSDKIGDSLPLDFEPGK